MFSPFFFWPLWYLSFYDLRLLITVLVILTFRHQVCSKPKTYRRLWQHENQRGLIGITNFVQGYLPIPEEGESQSQINTMGATSGAGTAYPSGVPEFTPRFQWVSCYSIFSFMCNVLQIVVCPVVLFLLTIVLSVLLRFTDSDYPFGIFKLFLSFQSFFTLWYLIKVTL